MLARILFLITVATGCVTAPPKQIPECADHCRGVLELRDQTMKKFERLCLALSYFGARHHDDKNIQREVREGVMVCDYVYGSRYDG